MTSNEIMSNPVLYGPVMAGIAYILIFCVIMFRRAYKYGVKTGLSKERMKTATTSSAIYSVVSFISIVTGLFSLAVVLSVPWSWFRLSVVGAVTYELMAPGMVATGAGYRSIAALNMTGGPSIIGTVMFIMSICILGGIVGVLMFDKKVQFGLQTARRENGQTGALVTGVLFLAVIETFLPLQMTKGPVYLMVVLTFYLTVLIQIQMIKRFQLA